MFNHFERLTNQGRLEKPTFNKEIQEIVSLQKKIIGFNKGRDRSNTYNFNGKDPRLRIDSIHEKRQSFFSNLDEISIPLNNPLFNLGQILKNEENKV